MQSEFLIALFAALALFLSNVVTLAIIVYFWKTIVRDESGKRDMLKALLATHGTPSTAVLAGGMETTDREVDVAQIKKDQPPVPGPRRIAQ